MNKPILCYVDVGGTFTDAFLVDEEGNWSVGKASTTPKDASEGFYAAIQSALNNSELTIEESLSNLKVLGYGATTALNALLTRSGGNPGLLVTKGFENMLVMGRGKQSWTEMDRENRLHPVTHRQLPPLVSKQMTRGITGRIDSLGREFIPLNKEEVRSAVTELLEAGADGLAIIFQWSFLNTSHEDEAVQIAKEVAMEFGKADIPIYCSHQISPVIRELPRANATVIESYVGPMVRNTFAKLEDRLKQGGYQGQLQIMQSAGGLAPARHVKIVDTLQSGPVGGLTGGAFIGNLYGFNNMITADVGGTSFDVGLVTGGKAGINREPTVAQMLVGTPMVEVMSIGAGGGTIAMVDPLTGRLKVGPRSAGADPGPVCYGKGGVYPTVTDADLVLGYIDPDNFLGGRVKLDYDAAHEALRKYIAEPLHISVIEAAEGIREIIDTKMRESIGGLVLSRGFDISEYHLLAFGGGGPTHCAGYTSGLPLKGVLIFPFSSVFSAFGSSAADYEHRYTHSLNMVVQPDIDENGKIGLGNEITRIWNELKQQAIEQMTIEGFRKEEIRFQNLAMIRYGRQLNDLIVTSPVSEILTSKQWDLMIHEFEKQYEMTFSGAAKYPQAGYEIFEVGLVASAPKIRPQLKHYPLQSAAPASKAYKGKRNAYFGIGGTSYETSVYELRELQPGNIVNGPAIIEDPTTTIVVPPNRLIRMDQYRSLWLENQ